MPATKLAIRQAMAAQLNAVGAITALARASAYADENLNPPAVFVVNGPQTPHLTLGGLGGQRRDFFDAWAVVSANNLETASDYLDRLLDTRTAESIPAAIEANKTLGGVVNDLVLTEVGDKVQPGVWAGVPVWTNFCRFSVLS